MIVIRRALLKRLLDDKAVVRRVDEAKSWREATLILAEEARKRGYKVAEA